MYIVSQPAPAVKGLARYAAMSAMDPIRCLADTIGTKRRREAPNYLSGTFAIYSFLSDS
jgi:hypothetical protein